MWYTLWFFLSKQEDFEMESLKTTKYTIPTQVKVYITELTWNAFSHLQLELSKYQQMGQVVVAQTYLEVLKWPTKTEDILSSFMKKLQLLSGRCLGWFQ